MNDEMLMKLAVKARQFSYSPYSSFRVGAALLCEDGSVYTGCNVENAAFTPGICAERTAFAKAVSEGKRKFLAIAVAGGPGGAGNPDERGGANGAGGPDERDGADGSLAFTAPCGVCRQVMREFCDPDSFRIVLGVLGEGLQSYYLRELLPFSFGPDNLKQNGDGEDKEV